MKLEGYCPYCKTNEDCDKKDYPEVCEIYQNHVKFSEPRDTYQTQPIKADIMGIFKKLNTQGILD